MTKNLFALSIVLVVFSGAAFAQPGAPSGPGAPPAAAPAEPRAAEPAGARPAAPSANPAARQACSDAMNSDPQFAAEIIRVADERAALKRDAETVAAHVDANHKVQRNERHVIYAYAAMWIIAAGFVIFLWRRQQALKIEIAGLRRDLEAAAADNAGKGRA